MFTKAQFDAFDPRERGFIVFMCGSIRSQPNIPDEDNPYPLAAETKAHLDWALGQIAAWCEAQDAL